jgi:predicted Zn-dependent peptidase
LVKEKEIFSHVHAYITGDIDKGLFVIEGKLNDKIEFEIAESSVLEILKDISENGLNDLELQKVKNKSLTSNLFAKTSVLNKAMALCYSYRLGDINLVNTDIELIKSIQNADIQAVCKKYLLNNTQVVLKYKTI